jgi:uncharacterized protein
MPAQPARILQIHIVASDRHEGESLHEAIVARCRELGIAGATVFQGVEGYGESAELHRTHLVRSDPPIVVTIVDTPENLARLVPVVEAMMDTGVIAQSDVEMVRVQTGSGA